MPGLDEATEFLVERRTSQLLQRLEQVVLLGKGWGCLHSLGEGEREIACGPCLS